ncbi:hypothetical protein DMO16_00630 [Fictibacillus sp. S7]|nr:hypothetical protein DMO16_00630 [Fictibacillus sp. S7]
MPGQQYGSGQQTDPGMSGHQMGQGMPSQQYGSQQMGSGQQMGQGMMPGQLYGGQQYGSGQQMGQGIMPSQQMGQGMMPGQQYGGQQYGMSPQMSQGMIPGQQYGGQYETGRPDMYGEDSQDHSFETYYGDMTDHESFGGYEPEHGEGMQELPNPYSEADYRDGSIDSQDQDEE